jgi:hypothetical protein
MPELTFVEFGQSGQSEKSEMNFMGLTSHLSYAPLDIFIRAKSAIGALNFNSPIATHPLRRPAAVMDNNTKFIG